METEGCVLVCKQTACVKMREAPRTASENNKLWMNCSYQPCAASHHWRGTSKYHMPNYNQTHHSSQLPQLRLSSHTVVVPRNEIIRVKNTIRNSEISCGCCLTIKRGGYKKKGMRFQLWRFTGVLETEDFINTPWLDWSAVSSVWRWLTSVSGKHILQDSCIARGAESSTLYPAINTSHQLVQPGAPSSILDLAGPHTFSRGWGCSSNDSQEKQKQMWAARITVQS